MATLVVAGEVVDVLELVRDPDGSLRLTVTAVSPWPEVGVAVVVVLSDGTEIPATVTNTDVALSLLVVTPA